MIKEFYVKQRDNGSWAIRARGLAFADAPTEHQAQRLANMLNDLEAPRTADYAGDEQPFVRARICTTIETFRVQEGLTREQVLGYSFKSHPEDFERFLNESRVKPAGA